MSLKNLLLILSGVGALILLILIFKNPTIRALGGYTEKNTTVEIDTTYLPAKIDTLEVFNAYIETKGIVLNPKPIIKYVFPDNESGEGVGTPIDSLKHFNVSVQDSVIDGTISIFNRFNGDLFDAVINYRPLVPKTILRTEYMTITKTVTETLSNDKSRIGFGIGANTEKFLSGGVEYITKDNLGIEIEYENTRLFNDQNYPIPEHIVGIKLKKYF